MATLPLVAVEDYLATSYPDGDREYLDGVVVERNVGTPEHSALQRILIVYLSSIARELNLSVLPECRTRIHQTRYRVPDVLVMERPFRRSTRVVFDAPSIIIEVLSPEDRMGDTLERFREYDKLGVSYIIQMDPVRRTAQRFTKVGLIECPDVLLFELRDGKSFPFPTQELLARLDDEEPAVE